MKLTTVTVIRGDGALFESCVYSGTLEQAKAALLDRDVYACGPWIEPVIGLNIEPALACKGVRLSTKEPVTIYLVETKVRQCSHMP